MDKDKEYIQQIKSIVKTYNNFPIDNYLFYDFSPLLLHPELMEWIFHQFFLFYKEMNANVIVGAESWGYIFGYGTAVKYNLPFIPVRKQGKLPGETISAQGVMAYNSVSFEMQTDAINVNHRVLIIDDSLATGGSTNCIIHLVELCKGSLVGACYLYEIVNDKGRDNVSIPIMSLIQV